MGLRAPRVPLPLQSCLWLKTVWVSCGGFSGVRKCRQLRAGKATPRAGRRRGTALWSRGASASGHVPRVPRGLGRGPSECEERISAGFSLVSRGRGAECCGWELQGCWAAPGAPGPGRPSHRPGDSSQGHPAGLSPPFYHSWAHSHVGGQKELRCPLKPAEKQPFKIEVPAGLVKCSPSLGTPASLGAERTGEVRDFESDGGQS